MYESFFRFRQRPFASVPRPAFYFPAEVIEQARQTLTRCIERGEGPALVVGPSGCGKSLLCHLLASELGTKFRVAMLATARLCTRRGLLQNILFEMGLPYRDMEEGELRLSLVDHLDPVRHDSPPLLLLIDEAHALPLRLLEEIRMITNLVRHGQPCVRLVLLGGAALEERFAMPRLQSFNQRLAARCYLDSLGRDETFSYVRYQIERAGGDDAIFTEDALQAVYHASDGVPRIINQVCDHALILACAGGKRQIDSLGIEESWADLQQLPAPQLGHDDDGESPQHEVIEFGQLDDLDDDAPATQHQAHDRHVAADRAEEAGSEQVEFQVVSCDEQLDEIEQNLSLVGEDTALEAQPAAAESQVELQFHVAHDPFSETFEEEEVVIDRYATLEAALTGRPRVRSRQGQEIAALLPAKSAQLEETSAASPAPQPAVSPAPQPAASPAAAAVEFGSLEELVEPASETAPAAPTYAAPPEAEQASEAEEASEREIELVYSFHPDEEAPSQEQDEPTAAVSLERQPEGQDDRDVIEVEEEEEPAAAVRREGYHDLFSRLRQEP